MAGGRAGSHARAKRNEVDEEEKDGVGEHDLLVPHLLLRELGQQRPCAERRPERAQHLRVGALVMVGGSESLQRGGGRPSAAARTLTMMEKAISGMIEMMSTAKLRGSTE